MTYQRQPCHSASSIFVVILIGQVVSDQKENANGQYKKEALEALTKDAQTRIFGPPTAVICRIFSKQLFPSFFVTLLLLLLLDRRRTLI
jgi:hypothetical protein